MSQFSGELSGKVVIVTGASQGIGAAACKEFAANGASVVLAARSEGKISGVAKEITDGGGKALAVPCDVSSADSVKALVDKTVDAFGTVDVLVNNAGVVEPIARMNETDIDAWSKSVDVNYKGVYYGMRLVLPIMLEKKAGVIVNISSGAARGAMEGWSQYCSSKAAAYMLTKAGHKEFAEHGIRVVGLSPGTVRTEMQVSIKDSGINPVSQLDPSVHIPPEWAGKAVCFLCTEKAKPFDGDDFNLRDDDNRRLVGLI